ncbi:LacI family DNA-binding transcriptional regulator [Pseudaminobacter soli (ex Li et al. 2025)]|uniref:LacI family transcriptional regulator n=1 Tax=Pseudaminobacter soli (ex Li et al. 2025) TaxID=1295366 RepID=A0A2P7SJX2_9HYPH|nr:LacI family DNA-binding transcriptional regulator [Mesorhizobium soli]PSJ62780.1 LacI family transcriptional regulator [Mesorhizobium soli]
MRPTVHHVAEEAGVSLATVDRVLNRRPGVRAKTVTRVNEAIAKLGYVRDISAANLAKQRVYNLVFIIPEGPNSFMLGLESELGQAKLYSALERINLDILKVRAFDSDALANVLDGLDLTQISGVALVATESHRVQGALARLRQANIPVVTLVSDVSAAHRDHYVGIDNVAAGRTAASLMGRFVGHKPGKIALLAGSMLVRDHVERRIGFEQVISAEFPELDCLTVQEGRDDAMVTRSVLADFLGREPGIVGLYSIGAGNRGVIDVLTSKPEYGSIAVVAHELTEHSKRALREGVFDAVINQDAGHEVRSAIRLLKASIDETQVIAKQEIIRIEIYIRDNLP